MSSHLEKRVIFNSKIKFNIKISKSISVLFYYFVLLYLFHFTQGAEKDELLILDLWNNSEALIKFPMKLNKTILNIKPSTLSLKKNAFISISLLSMHCNPPNNLSLMSANSDLNKIWCYNKTEENNATLAEPFLLSDFNNFHLKINGNWMTSTAVLLATIYHGTRETCTCDPDFFCCISSCPYSDNFHTNYRCMSNDLLCNGQINCGFPCHNSDENEDFCYPSTTMSTTEEDPCIANPHSCEVLVDESPYIWTIVGIAGVAALIFMGFFFFCLWYRSRTDWGIERDTPYPRHPSVINLKEEGPGGTIISQNRRLSVPQSQLTINPAATAVMNIRNMTNCDRKAVYSFEDV